MVDDDGFGKTPISISGCSSVERQSATKKETEAEFVCSPSDTVTTYVNSPFSGAVNTGFIDEKSSRFSFGDQSKVKLPFPPDTTAFRCIDSPGHKVSDSA